MWNYALMSKLAKIFGGPAAFVATIFTAGFVAGRIYDKRGEIIEGAQELIQKLQKKIASIKDENKLKVLKTRLVKMIKKQGEES